jgi:intracellular sulfur oxidation DsrE/DsrF family protein
MGRLLQSVVVSLALIAMPALGADVAASAPAGSEPYKLIIHVGDGEPAKWNVALNNAANAQKELGASNVEVELVAINAGLGMLKYDSVVSGRVTEAMKNGVKIVACENSMKAQKVTRDDMVPGIGYVSAGIVELMERQRQGYAYVRP